MVRWGKCKTKSSQHMIEMPLEINYRLRRKTSCLSHTSQNNQTPTAPSGKPWCPHACVHLWTALIRRLWRQPKNKMGENVAEGEEARDNLTGLFLTKYNKTTRDCSNLCCRLWVLGIRCHQGTPTHHANPRAGCPVPTAQTRKELDQGRAADFLTFGEPGGWGSQLVPAPDLFPKIVLSELLKN